MRAIVTGATGFIGGNLARVLAARGDAVTAIVRSPEKAGALREAGVDIAAGDITDRGSLTAVMRGADAVFHLAAWYEIGVTDRALMEKINVEGTANVLAAAKAAEVSRIVHCSSIAVFGAHAPGEISDESTVHPGHFGSLYEETKVRAHQVAADAAATGAPVTIVMPGAVYGPGDTSMVGALLHYYARGWLIACPMQSAGLCWVHVDDLVEGILAAHDRGGVGEQYILGGENATIREVFATLAPLTGITPPRIQIGPMMMRLSSPLSPLIGKVMHAGPRVVADAIATLNGSFMASSAKAAAQIGYVFRDVADAMPQTVEWFARKHTKAGKER